MHHLIFSTSALLGTDVVTTGNMSVGTLEDVICNKDSGKLTYLIVNAGAYLGGENQLYAIHHSFFYLNGDDEALILDPQRGQSDPAALNLPDHYDDATVLGYADFVTNVLNQLQLTGHRSDYD